MPMGGASPAGGATTPGEPLAEVRSGVFFAVSPELPRGRHTLSRDQVSAVQRERCLIAATELLAGRGYAAFGIREICTRAAISQATFYRCFADREACIYAAYQRFIEVLTQHLTTAEPPTHEDPAIAFVRSYFEALERDPVSARAFQVEMESLGREARRRRREALAQLTSALDLRRSAWRGQEVDLPAGVTLALVHAVRQLASDHLDEGGHLDAGLLTERAIGWVRQVLG